MRDYGAAVLSGDRIWGGTGEAWPASTGNGRSWIPSTTERLAKWCPHPLDLQLIIWGGRGTISSGLERLDVAGALRLAGELGASAPWLYSDLSDDPEIAF